MGAYRSKVRPREDESSVVEPVRHTIHVSVSRRHGHVTMTDDGVDQVGVYPPIGQDALVAHGDQERSARFDLLKARKIPGGGERGLFVGPEPRDQKRAVSAPVSGHDAGVAVYHRDRM